MFAPTQPTSHLARVTKKFGVVYDENVHVADLILIYKIYSFVRIKTLEILETSLPCKITIIEGMSDCLSRKG